MKSFAEMAKRLKNCLSRKAFSVLLAVAGATMVTVGVWTIFAPAGWIVGGAFAFLFEYRVVMDTPNGDEGRAG